MSIVKSLLYLFLPHESNNQKAKMLHSSSLSLLAVSLIFVQLVITGVSKIYPTVLGCASSISASDVVRLTNEKRTQSGLSPLSENSVLSQAAQAKGTDMFNKNYWAHFAPDGTSPWSFFNNFGYRYKYAGENLARDFCSASQAVDAWMNSPTHRENILSPNYREIGIGVIDGNLSGSDTTIIVQFFGTRPTENVAMIPEVKAQNEALKVVSTPSPTPEPILAQDMPTVAIREPNDKQVLISPFRTTKDLSMAVVGLLLLLLSIDLILIRRKRVTRMGGKTLAHIAFLGMILAVVLILKAGQII